ncbi:ribulose-phosphate 3-epimerase [Porphyromonadaceae bacterium]
MNNKPILSPSILAADFGNLQRDVEMINRSDADWFHLDIMDGVFVPNISFGFPVMAEIARYAMKPLDVHLMIVEPMKFIREVKELGTYMMNVHYEACPHLHRNIQQIKNEGMKAGVTLNPHTPVSVLEEIIIDLDMVLLMSVNPGFGGQTFIENTLDKTARLKELIAKRNSSALIQVDGGVNFETGKQLLDSGADVLVAGSFIFNSSDPLQTIARLKEL